MATASGIYGTTMTLDEQVARRVALARQIGCEPVRWIATAEAAALAGATADQLHGLPVERGKPRSDWGLDLVVARL